MKKIGIFTVLAIMLVAAAPAMAAQVSQTLPFDFTISPGGTPLLFNQFDDNGGLYTLSSVTLILDVCEGGHITAENDSDQAGEITVSMAGWAQGSGPDLLAFTTLSQSDGPVWVDASDGVPESGLDFWDFGHVFGCDSDSDVQNTNLAPYIGAGGTIDIDIYAEGGWALAGISDATLTITDFKAWGDATIIYEYTQVPEPVTLGLMAIGGLGLAIVRRKRK